MCVVCAFGDLLPDFAWNNFILLVCMCSGSYLGAAYEIFLTLKHHYLCKKNTSEKAVGYTYFRL